MQLRGTLQVPGTCDSYCPKQEGRLFEARFVVHIVFTEYSRQKLAVVVEEPSNFAISVGDAFSACGGRQHLPNKAIVYLFNRNVLSAQDFSK